MTGADRERKAKPMGPIPSGFSSEEGVLIIGGVGYAALIDEAGGTPLFAYDARMITDRVALLRAAMPPGLDIHYAVKANPFAPLLAHMVGLVDGFDIASAGELNLAQEAGMAEDRISFAGPGKNDDALEQALAAGVTINLESEGEGARALRIAQKLGVTPRLAVRVNPDFELKRLVDAHGRRPPAIRSGRRASGVARPSDDRRRG